MLIGTTTTSLLLMMMIQPVAADLCLSMDDYMNALKSLSSCDNQKTVVRAAKRLFKKSLCKNDGHKFIPELKELTSEKNKKAAKAKLQDMCYQQVHSTGDDDDDDDDNSGNPPSGESVIAAFRLIDADTDDILVSELQNGAMYNIGSSLEGASRFAVVVEADPDVVGHMDITSQFGTWTEGTYPYASFGNGWTSEDEPDYNGKTLQPFNTYEFSATVFDKDGNQMGDKVSMSFDVVTDIETNGCTSRIVIERLEDECDCDAEAYLQKIMGVGNINAVYSRLDSICHKGWQEVPTNDWSVINDQLTDEHVMEFLYGGTQMNLGTGNLAQDPVPKYTTAASVQEIADSVGEFYGHGDGPIEDTRLRGMEHLLECESHAIMCCWGRDRQSNDNNGNCAADDCDDASPADNTNFCAIEDEGEGDTHCHGLAWSNDPNDFSAQFKYNNLFYVSMYDHWYQRGYVENSLDGDEVDEFGLSAFPMCSCIDEMPPVSRSDCTEMHVTMPFEVTFSASGIEAIAGEIENIDFNACDGPRFNGNGNKHNDLSTYINKLEHHDQMTNDMRMHIFENVLVGYENPDDNQNEAACEDFIAIRAGVELLKLWDAKHNVLLTDLHDGMELSISDDLGGVTSLAVEAVVPYPQLVGRIAFNTDFNGEDLFHKEYNWPYLQFGNSDEYDDIGGRSVVAGGEYTVTAQAFDEDSHECLGDAVTATFTIVA